MPDLTFAIGADGLILGVLVGLDRTASQIQVARGDPLPRPQLVRALLDTGSDLTAVSSGVLANLGARAGRFLSTHTAGGVVRTPTFYVSLSIPPASGAAAPLLVVPRLRVTRLNVPIPDLDVLIGVDLILQFYLHIDGPGRAFTFTF
jgi:hypothetical protein